MIDPFGVTQGLSNLYNIYNAYKPSDTGHTGAWGTKEYGLSEMAQGLFKPSQAYASSGGSDFFQDQKSASGSPVGPMSVATQSPYNPSPSDSGGQVLGSQSSNLGSMSLSPTVTNPSDGGSGSSSGYNEAFLKELDSAYNSVLSPLQGAKNRLQEFIPGYLSDIQAQYGNQMNKVSQNETNQIGNLDQQRMQSEQMAGSALGDARRVYQELLQGNMAMFGGGGAGRFAQSILGRSTAGQMGDINQGLVNQKQKIAGDVQRVKEETAMQLQDLTSQRDAAVRSAQLQLQNQLGEIDQQIAWTNEQRANARLSAIQNFQAQAHAIHAQAVQFQQQLQLNQQQLLTQLAGMGMVGANDLMQGFGFGQPGMQVMQQAAPANDIGAMLRFLPTYQGEDQQLNPVGVGQ